MTMKRLFLATVLAQVLLITSTEAAPNKLQVLRERGKTLLQSPVGKWLLEKAPQQAATLGIAAFLACGTIALNGCDQARTSGVYDVIDTEYIDPGDEYAGQYVTFYINGEHYEGYWEITPDNQILVEIDNANERLVLLEYLKGERIPNHSDIGAQVVMMGLRNGQHVDQYGEVVEVYDNGIYIIDVWEVEYINSGQVIEFNIPRRMATHASVLEEDGGFTFLDD